MSHIKALIGAIGARLLSWGPWGALALAFLDSAGIPVPVGVDALVLTLAAYHSGVGYFGAALAVLGSVAGSVVLFMIGRKGGEAYLDQRTQRGWPQRFRRWFHHYGGITIFIPVLVPVPLPVKIFVLSAGALGMRRTHFVVLVTLARMGRYFGLAYLGSQMGAKRPLEYLKGHAWELVGVSVALFLVSYILVKRADYLRARAHHLHTKGHGAAHDV